MPGEPENALSFWEHVGNTREIGRQATADLAYTSLVGQLVPDVRPEEALAREWPERVPDGDGQQVQICQIVETKNGQSATAEGLFYQLIVRLHKFSLGRADYRQSVHWQRGLSNSRRRRKVAKTQGICDASGASISQESRSFMARRKLVGCSAHRVGRQVNTPRTESQGWLQHFSP